MNGSINVYLLDYKAEGDNKYSDVYIDFRTLKDLRMFNHLMGLELMEQTVIHFANLSANKRLRRRAYYQLNLHLLQDNNVEGHLVADNLVVGYSFNFSHTSWRENEHLLDKHQPLDSEEVTFVNHATSDIFAGLANMTNDLKLRVNDVGQGNCNEIIDGNSVKIVYDIGATMNIKQEDVSDLKNKRIGAYKTSRPLLIISHWDVDHFIQLKVMTDQELMCFSGLLCSSKQPSLLSQKTYERLEKSIGKDNVNSVSMFPVQNHNDRMYLYMKVKDLNLYYGKKATGRNYSGFTMLVQGNLRSAFLTGDCNYSQVTDVLSQEANGMVLGKNLVLMAPHHGGTFSAKFNVLSIPHAFKAEEAVISVSAANNSYGHPAKTTVKMLQSKFLQVSRTDVVGDIVCDL